jgi:hypothetical protein
LLEYASAEPNVDHTANSCPLRSRTARSFGTTFEHYPASAAEAQDCILSPTRRNYHYVLKGVRITWNRPRAGITTHRDSSRPIPKRLGDVIGRYRGTPFEIGDRSPDAQHAMVAARRQLERLHGGRHQCFRLAIDGAVREEPTPGCMGIAPRRSRKRCIPPALHRATRFDAAANRERRVTVAGIGRVLCESSRDVQSLTGFENGADCLVVSPNAVRLPSATALSHNGIDH